jgi:drug/metabolite transporter (DMT)-like permease
LNANTGCLLKQYRLFAATHQLSLFYYLQSPYNPAPPEFSLVSALTYLHRMVRFIPVIFVLLWSTGFIAAKFALPYIEPYTLLLVRMLITVVVFLLLIQLFKTEWPKPIDAFHQMVVGSLIHAAYLGGVFAAIKLNMPAGIASLIVGLQPLLTAIMAWLVLGNQLKTRQWLGLLLGLIGVSMVLLQGKSIGFDNISLSAVIAILIALFGISIGTLYQKKYGQGSKLLSGSFFQYLATVVWMGLLSTEFETQQITWSLTLMASLAWLVVVLSIIAIMLLMLMIREGESARVASYFYLVPQVTVLEGWLLFDEQLNLAAFIGIAITVVGVYLVVKTKLPASKPK